MATRRRQWTAALSPRCVAGQHLKQTKAKEQRVVTQIEIYFFLLERLNVYICTVLNSILTYKEIVLNVHKICVICREGKQDFCQIRFSLFSETFDYVLYIKNIRCRFDGKSCKVKTHIDLVRLHSCLQDSPFCYWPRASKLLGHFFRPIQVPLFSHDSCVYLWRLRGVHTCFPADQVCCL